MHRQFMFLVCALAITACGSRTTMPLVSPQTPRERFLVQREFRLGTFDFGRVSDSRELSKVIPAMLLTELRDVGRFAIYEGGNIRAHGTTGDPLHEGNASQYVDGYLSGTVTTLTDQQACLELRLSNAVTHEVLYSRPVCIALENEKVDRDVVKRIAEEIARAVKQVGNGAITSVDGRMVFCNKGSKSGVSRGMVAYIVGTGDTVRDSSLHQQVRTYTGVDPAQLTTIATPVIIGEMYIVEVYPKYSVGLLHKGKYALPGDTVFFK